MTGATVPNTYCTILATSQDIVLVCVDGSHSTSVCLCNVPDHCLSIYGIEAAKESIAVADENGVIVGGIENARSC